MTQEVSMHSVIVLISLLSLAWPAAAQSRSVSDGVYTKEQAKRGQSIYIDQCAQCHSENLGGGESAPALVGDVFLQRWKGLTVSDLFERILHSMPSDNPESLSPKQVSELVAHILSANGFPAGRKDLDRDTGPLKEIRMEAKP
jgi:mono/diheme cytochrome c family protein